MIENLVPPRGLTRVLALSELVCRIGDGTYYVCAALFFTRVVGISPVQMGLGLTIGWSAALVLSVPLGHVADRRGPRGAAVVMFVCAAMAVASYLFISSFALFVVATSVYAVCQRGGSAAQQALLVGLAPEQKRVQVRAFVQSSYNAGLAMGAGLGGLVLLFDRREWYYAAFVLNALTFVAASAVLSRLPAVPPAPASPRGAVRTSVFKDRPYIAFTALNTLILLYIPLFDIALPLWISRHTAAPLWLLSVMFTLNTVTVVIFQVRMSRGVSGLHSARRYVLYGSILLGAGCVVFAVSGAGDSAWMAGALLLAAVTVQVMGEMMQAAGSWELSFGLAPDGKHGQYQAFFANGFTIAEIAGPLVLTGLVVYWGPPGWIVLGALFVAAAALMQPTVRWGARVRAGQPQAGSPAAMPETTGPGPARSHS